MALLLGRVALVAQRPIVVKLSRERSVGPYVRYLLTCVYVRVSVCPVHCGKTANRIRMPFGIVGRTGPEMRQVVGFGDRSTGRVLSGAHLGRAIVNIGTLRRTCSTAPRRGPLPNLLWANLL